MKLNFGHPPLSSSMRPGMGAAPSFLPEDYLRRKRERRSDFIALTLFCIVMFGVVAAFFVTNRQWTEVKALHAVINAEYVAEGKRIDELNVLEAQKKEMLDKAEITAALIERVPRSILMAELINRMPEQLTLTDVKLTGKRIKDAPAVDPKDKAKPKPRSLAGGGEKGDAKEAAPKPVPPRFEFTLELIGLAASDAHVADYHAALKECPLLEGVDLLYSGNVVLDEVERRKFRIEARIRATADARNIEPLHIPRHEGLAARVQIGPDGKPLPQAPIWVQRHGLTSSKLPLSAAPPAGAAPGAVAPASADATPTPGPELPPPGDHP